MEQADEAGQQQRQRERDVAGVGAAPALDPPAEQRIDERRRDARGQQRGPDQRQRQPRALGVELWQVDVDRQRDHGQRQAEEAVAQQHRQPDRFHGGAACLSSAWRSAGAVVAGSSQMPKKARANSGSSTFASALPSR